MIVMIVYTKIDQSRIHKESTVETETVKQAGGAATLLLSDKLIGLESNIAEGSVEEDSEYETDSKEEGQILGPAERMDLRTARKEAFGLVAELDYVSADKISLHGNFGYMVYRLEKHEDGTFVAVNTNAVTFKELGGLTMGGAAYTDVLAGDGSVLIVPGIHNEEIARRRKFLYIEETNEITGGIVAPAWMMEKMAVNDYSDAIVDTDAASALAGVVKNFDGSKVLYGPVRMEDSSDRTYGFLATSGEILETIWYGLWDQEMGTIEKIPLF